MKICEKIRDEKVHYNINREAIKYLHYHQVKLINMNFLRQRNIAI